MEAARKKFRLDLEILERKKELEMRLIEEEFNAELDSLEDEVGPHNNVSGEPRNQETGNGNDDANDELYRDLLRNRGSQWGNDNNSQLGSENSRNHNNEMLSNSIKELAHEISRAITESRREKTLETSSQGIIKKMSIGKALPIFDGDILE